MALKRRQFTREFKLRVVREVDAGKPIAQVAPTEERIFDHQRRDASAVRRWSVFSDQSRPPGLKISTFTISGTPLLRGSEQ